MKKALHIISLVLIASNMLAQNSFEIGYEGNPNISDTNGKPINNESIYFPVIKAPYVSHYLENDGTLRWIADEHIDLFINEFGKERIKDSLSYHCIDTISQIIYSKYLFEFGEPILYNYYLGRNIVRFSYFRAFDHPIVIKLENFADSTLLTLKILDYQIDYTLVARAYDGDVGLISTCDNIAEWIINEQSKIDNSSFVTLQSMIQDLNIKEEAPFYSIICGSDGSDWVIEIHSEKGYYYNKRWSPSESSSNRKIAEYLIRISGLKENIY